MLKHIFTLITVIAFALNTNARSWKADSLAGYERTTITRTDGDRCVVIRKRSVIPSETGILYVHGYNDYFFQSEMGDRFVDSCYNFYAVDLHGYGRSMRPGVRPYQARSVDEYFADLDSALSVMHSDGVRQVVLMGHSTGGLITSCYLNAENRPEVRALVLNSPFFRWNMSPFMRDVLVPIVSSAGALFPGLAISQGDGTAYGESLLKGLHGRWNFNVEWKTVHPRKVTAGWIKMISDAQARLTERPEHILVPILLMHSAADVNASRWTAEVSHADAVLNVRDISEVGRTLGPSLTEMTVSGGLHDLMLSAPEVTDALYPRLFDWLFATVPPVVRTDIL